MAQLYRRRRTDRRHLSVGDEAVNSECEMFGDERIQATIRQGCTEGLSAEALVDRLLAEVRSFCGDVAQKDDMTCAVVRVTA